MAALSNNSQFYANRQWDNSDIRCALSDFIAARQGFLESKITGETLDEVYVAKELLLEKQNSAKKGALWTRLGVGALALGVGSLFPHGHAFDFGHADFDLNNIGYEDFLAGGFAGHMAGNIHELIQTNDVHALQKLGLSFQHRPDTFLYHKFKYGDPIGRYIVAYEEPRTGNLGAGLAVLFSSGYLGFLASLKNAVGKDFLEPVKRDIPNFSQLLSMTDIGVSCRNVTRRVIGAVQTNGGREFDLQCWQDDRGRSMYLVGGIPTPHHSNY